MCQIETIGIFVLSIIDFISENRILNLWKYTFNDFVVVNLIALVSLAFENIGFYLLEKYIIK